MKIYPINRDLKLLLTGITLSLLANYLIYIHESPLPGKLGKLQFTICMNLPFVIMLFLAAIGFIIVGLLRGKTDSDIWGRSQMENILVK